MSSPKSSVKRTAHALYDLWFHVAWSTKYRKPVLVGKIKEETKSLFRTIAAHHDCELSQSEILPDHVHLLLSIPPRLAPAQLIQYLKSYSTHQLFKLFPHLRDSYWGGELWIAGYFIRSVGPGLTKEAIENYLTQQGQPRRNILK